MSHTFWLPSKKASTDIENFRYILSPENNAQTLKIIKQFRQPWRLEQDFWSGLVVCVTGNNTIVGEIAFRDED